MNYKTAILNKTKQIISELLKMATQADTLTQVLSKNNSLIVADVDPDQIHDFKNRYYEFTGKKISDEESEQIFIRDPSNLRKGKKQLRIFFNASPEEIRFLNSNDIFPIKARGSAALKAAPMAREFNFVINDTAMLYELLRDPSFHLGLNVNYNQRLHPEQEEIDWQQEYYKIKEQLDTATDEQEIARLKDEKEQILEVIRKLEDDRLGR